MNVQKQRDAPRRPSAGRVTKRRPCNSARRAEDAGSTKNATEIRQALARAGHRSFADDFNLEHSHTNGTITLTSISANAELVEKATPGHARFYAQYSPSCVYIG